MPRYRVTAEHSSGASVSHPCATGIYDDPANVFEREFDAEDELAAEVKARDELAKAVDSADPCDCRRKLSPGGSRWWGSVAFIIEEIK